jgi:hypothetical protein
MMACVGLCVIFIYKRLLQDTLKALPFDFVFVVELYIISTVTGLFKMRSNYRPHHGRPPGTPAFSPNKCGPANEEADEYVEYKPTHDVPRIAKAI